MDLPFINKYQPIYLKEFEMDGEIINLLRMLIKMDTLNILIVGNPGTGKTAMINAIVREYYDNTNYNDDILYINNLNEQGIQYYRTDVKTFCQTTCTIPGKKKTIILDDIDNINEQSQQIFRNCIDKYSHNVHFIQTCNNTQKVIESLQSRSTIIKIKPISIENMYKIFVKISSIENIVIDHDAKQFIVDVSNYSVKTLISNLEKFKLLDTRITMCLATKLCTNINFFNLQEYTKLLLKNELISAISLLYSIYNIGYSVMDILDAYFLYIKTTDLVGEDLKYQIIEILCKYIIIFNDTHENEIELALMTNNLINLKIINIAIII
jgi:DNA polymerase III delta prime subunit